MARQRVIQRGRSETVAKATWLSPTGQVHEHPIPITLYHSIKFNGLPPRGQGVPADAICISMTEYREVGDLFDEGDGFQRLVCPHPVHGAHVVDLDPARFTITGQGANLTVAEELLPGVRLTNGFLESPD